MEPILTWADDNLAYEPSPHRTSYKRPDWVDDLSDRAEDES